MRFLLLICLLWRCEAAPELDYRATYGSVDERVALSLGELNISQYIVEKNLYRDLTLSLYKASETGSSFELEDWLGKFSASRLNVKKALEMGLAEDTTVREDVEIMSRYIMTQPRGQGYHRLLSALYTKEEGKKFHRSNRIDELRIVFKKAEVEHFSDNVAPFLNEPPIYHLAICSCRNRTIAKYYDVTGENRALRVIDLFDLYRSRVNRPRLIGVASVEEYIREALAEEADYQEAKNLGFMDNPKFKQDKLNYMHRRVLIKLREKIKNEVLNVGHKEAEIFYKHNISKYALPAKLSVIRKKYKTRESAFRSALVHASKRDENESGEIMDLSVEELERKTLNLLLALESNQKSLPIKVGSVYHVYTVLEKSGVYTPPLDTIYDSILNDLAEERVDKKMKEMSTELKRETEIIDRIDRVKLAKLAAFLRNQEKHRSQRR